MKRPLYSIFILMVSFCFLSTANAQKTGLELYETMGSRTFLSTDGSPSLNWLPGNLGYMETERTDDGHVNFYKVDPKNKKRTSLFDKSTISAIVSQFNNATDAEVNTLPFNSFEYAHNNDAIFFTVDKVDFLFNLKANKLTKLYKPEIERATYDDELMRGMARSQLWNGTYSNDYSKFAYVKGYDIYVVDTKTKEEKRLTYGSEEKMNGRPSWVYPEEFGEREAYWFSPDDSKIAYLQYNEKDVHLYPIVHDLSFEAGLELMRYPKAGETNPTVNLFIVDIKTGVSEQVETNSNPDTYIVRPIWRNDGTELTFRRFNRQQNHLELLAYSLANKSVRTIFEEREDTYISLHDNFIQLDDNKTFLWTSEVSGYNQIYHYDFNGKKLHQLTSGDKPVASIIRVDQKNKKVYYTAHQNMGLETQFHVVNFDGKGKKQLSKEEGTHFISMNEAATYYTDYYSSFDEAPSASLYSANGKKVRSLMTSDTKNVVANNLQKPEFIIFKADDGVTDLPALIYKPVDFDPNKKYPVVLPLYGGPESQDVANSYKTADGYQRLAQLGFIVVRANYRGSGKRGKEFASLHYGRLGTLEIDDYAKAIKVITQRPYADGSRVGVYGHSYGGYSTALLMLRYPEIFHVGISGALVSDWRSYDTIYTERYMNTPQENKEGYDLGSTMLYADNLKGKLLIVHGTTDNNVHPGNSIQLIDALINANKEFDVMFYPENRHGIRGAHGLHYNKLRLRYLIDNLHPENIKSVELGPDLSWSN